MVNWCALRMSPNTTWGVAGWALVVTKADKERPLVDPGKNNNRKKRCAHEARLGATLLDEVYIVDPDEGFVHTMACETCGDGLTLSVLLTERWIQAQRRGRHTAESNAARAWCWDLVLKLVWVLGIGYGPGYGIWVPSMDMGTDMGLIDILGHACGPREGPLGWAGTCVSISGCPRHVELAPGKDGSDVNKVSRGRSVHAACVPAQFRACQWRRGKEQEAAAARRCSPCSSPAAPTSRPTSWAVAVDSVLTRAI